MKNILMTLILLAAVAANLPAGAHGPDGEHADDAHAGGAAADALPGVDITGSRFELGATLSATGWSILVDRYATNEPVLDARVALHHGGRTLPARFDAGRADYVIDDAAMLRALAAPGRHALAWSVTAAGATETLRGTLMVAPLQVAQLQPSPHGRTIPGGRWWLLALPLLVAVAWLLRRHTAREVQP